VRVRGVETLVKISHVVNEIILLGDCAGVS
jgi:hypothetical protein